MFRNPIPLFSVTAVALAAVAAAAQAEGDAKAGAIKGETCIGCHGVQTYYNVYPSYHVPKLVGQHPEYILAALKAYKSGERTHPTMNAQSNSMSDEDMADIAAWIATLSDKEE
ncbi:MAG: cytochrome c [Pseudomonadota bacterium]